jgi:hypothetical protein
MRASVGVQQAGRNKYAKGPNAPDEPERFWLRAPGMLTAASMKAEHDRALAELAAFAEQLVIFKGVNLAFPQGKGCIHEAGNAGCLTASRPSATGPEGDNEATGESVDSRIARAVNPPGVEPLTLMAGSPNKANLSYRGPREKRAPERSPRNALMRLLGQQPAAGAPGTASDVGHAELAARRKSVNDVLRSQLGELMRMPALSGDDKKRLELHLASVRDLEIRTQAACGASTGLERAVAELAMTASPSGTTMLQIVRLHLDIIAWAFSCDLNRTATLQVGNKSDTAQYVLDGKMAPGAHMISHRMFTNGASGDPIPDAARLHHLYDRLMLQQFLYLLEKLKEYRGPGGGTLLDDSVAVWLNHLGTGDHQPDNMPFILAGQASGKLRPGRFLDLKGAKNNVVLNTVLSAVGVRKPDGSLVDDFGDASLPRGVVRDVLA